MSNAPHLRVVHGDDASHDPTNTKARQHKGPYDYQQQRDIMRGIPRGWSPHLPAPEYQVLDVIFDQSIDMNREHLLTSYKKLEHGDPVAKTKGTGYSQRQLQRILGSLTKRGAMTVELTGRGLKITPNPNWKPGPDMPLASEKRKRAAKKAANTRRENGPPKPKLVSTLWPHPPRVDTLNPTAIEKTMRRAFEQEYSDLPGVVWKPWTADQHSSLARRINFYWTENEADQCHEFFEWIALYWRGLGKLRTMPEYPDIDFYCKWHRTMLLEFEYFKKVKYPRVKTAHPG